MALNYDLSTFNNVVNSLRPQGGLRANTNQTTRTPADSTGNRMLDFQNIMGNIGVDLSGLDLNAGSQQSGLGGVGNIDMMTGQPWNASQNAGLGFATQISPSPEQLAALSEEEAAFLQGRMNPPTLDSTSTTYASDLNPLPRGMMGITAGGLQTPYDPSTQSGSGLVNNLAGSGMGSQLLTGFGPLGANALPASGGPAGLSGAINSFTGGLTNAVSQGADFFKDLFSGQNIGNIIGGVGGAIAQDQIAKDVSALGKDATTAIFGQNYTVPEGGLIGEAQRNTQFKPFAVTTPTGTGSIGASGDLSLGLSPEQEALRKQFSTFATDAFGMLGDPEARAEEQANIVGMLTQDPAQRAAREQDVYDRLRAVQQPEEARAALELEERLFNQGRGGVRTAMYGGTPEQLAQAKAVEEAKALASVGAMDQARLEQKLGSEQTLAGLTETRQRLGMLGDLGLSGLGASYLPQDKLIAAMQPSLDASRIGAGLQATGATLGAGLGETGLEAQLGYEGLANAIRQQQFQGLFNMIMNQQNAQNQQNQPQAQDNSNVMKTIFDMTVGNNTPFIQELNNAYRY